MSDANFARQPEYNPDVARPDWMVDSVEETPGYGVDGREAFQDVADRLAYSRAKQDGEAVVHATEGSVEPVAEGLPQTASEWPGQEVTQKPLPQTAPEGTNW